MTRNGWLALGLVLALAGNVEAGTDARYVVLVDGGKQAGEQTVVEGEDGVTRATFIFKDNGRGPELQEEFSLNPDGTFRSYRVTGTSTFGAPVDERFELVDGVARWKSTSDQGEQAVAAGASVVAITDSPTSPLCAGAAQRFVVGALLQQELMPVCQYYAYVEILDEREIDVFRNATHGAALWNAYSTVRESWPNFAMKRIAQPGDIYPVFRELFAKQEH